MGRSEAELAISAAIDLRRARRAAERAKGGPRSTPRTRALRAIEPGGYVDFPVADAFDAASLRGSVASVFGRGSAITTQMDRATVRVYRARGTMATAMEAIAHEGYADFECRDDNHAASIRSSAYLTLGKGRAVCERVSKRKVRVWRL